MASLGRHDMTMVGLAPETFLAGAQREWDRTGTFRGGGDRYGLTWQSGEWRDEEYPSCGPEGQSADGFIGQLLSFRRRLPERNYMALCVALATARPWPLREGSLGRLFYYLFVRDPWELREQVAPVGCDLKKRGDSIVIQNNGADGLLHTFANDAWMTAANNSGGLLMTIERLPTNAAIDEPIWTFAPRVQDESKKRRADWIPAGFQPWRWSRSA